MDAGGPYTVSRSFPYVDLAASGTIEPLTSIAEYSWDLDGDYDPAAQESSFAIQSDPGERIGGGQSYNLGWYNGWF